MRAKNGRRYSSGQTQSSFLIAKVSNYKRKYLRSIDAGEQDIILCELCNAPAQAIHHIHEKGMGGRAGADELDNLIALCRKCHDRAHRGEIARAALVIIAKQRIRNLKGSPGPRF